MDNFQKEIDERTNLTSSNRFELLLFRLGTSPDDEQSELFGINVFKLREIVPMPTLTKAAGMVSPMMGMANIRGEIIPVIDLPAVVGCVPKNRPEHFAGHRICAQHPGVCGGIRRRHCAS